MKTEIETKPEPKPETIVDAPEFGLSSQLIDDLRSVIERDKYDQLRMCELLGVLNMLIFEYGMRWSRWVEDK